MTTPTTTPTRPPPRTNEGPPPAAPKTAAPEIKRPSKTKRGVRVVYVAVEGFGKTTTGALGPNPLMIMAPEEQGYLTLHSRSLVPELPMMQPRSWPQLLAGIEQIIGSPSEYETVVLDAMVGLEALCASWVCHTNFGGDWGERGFAAYGRGTRIVAREWPQLLARLSALADRGVNVLVLGHARVKRFNAPDGPDYDRYECNCGSDEVWARTKAWGEAVLFGMFRPIVEQNRPESNIAKAHGKAIAHERIMRCEYSAVADAKNQYGLEAEYRLPDEPRACAAAFWGLVIGGKAAKENRR